MTNHKWRRWHLLAAGVVCLLLVVALLALAGKAEAAEGRKPVDPPLVCVTVDQAQCRAVLTNSWDGRQVVHQLDPVPVCTPNRTVELQDRLERKGRTLAEVRAKVARLRARLAR